MMKWVFGADTKPFRRGLDEMRNHTRAFAGTVKNMLIGAFGFGAIIAGFRSLFTEMDRVQKLAIRFGESTDTIQKIGLAAKLAGSDMEGMARAMTVVTKNAGDAAKGNEAMAAAFNAIGIDAAKFVNLPLDQKVLALSGAFTSGKGSGEQLAEVMKVLGRGGAELIPLLSQGQEALQEQFNTTNTVSRSTIDSIAKVNDAMTKLKQNSQVAMANIIDGLKIWASYLEYGLNLMSGNRERGAELLEERLDNIVNGGGQDANINTEGLQDEAEAQIKVEEERKKLAEEIAKLEEESRIKQLSMAERLLELEKKRAQLDADELFGSDETAILQARKESLEVQKEIKAIRDKQAEEERRLEDQKAEREEQAAERILKLKEEEAALDREQALAKMSPGERRRALEKERDAERGRSEFLMEVGDEEGAIAASIRAKQIQADLDGMTGETSLPSILTDDLRKVGGGGPAALAAIDPQKEAVDRLDKVLTQLEQINQKTRDEGMIGPEPF